MGKKIFILSIIVLLGVHALADAPLSTFTFSDASDDVELSLEGTSVDNPGLDILSFRYEIKDSSFEFELEFADVPKLDMDAFYLIGVSFSLIDDVYTSVQWQVIYNSIVPSLQDGETDFNFHIDDDIKEGSGDASISGNSIIWSSDSFSGYDFSDYMDESLYEFSYASVEAYHLFESGNHIDKLDFDDDYPSNDNGNSSNNEDSSLVMSLAIFPVIGLMAKKSRAQK